MEILDKARQIAERKADDAKKSATDPKPQGNPVVRYFREIRDELRKVDWPKRDRVIRGTIIVIVLSAALAAVLGAADFVFTYGLEKTLDIF